MAKQYKFNHYTEKWDKTDDDFDDFDYESYLNRYNPPCHTGSIGVFTDPLSGITFYGGGKTRGLEIMADTVIIDIGAHVKTAFSICGTCPDGFLESTRKAYDNPIIKIDCEDFGTPILSALFWYTLAKDLRAYKHDVLVCCLGGHGRTGMILSIMAGMLIPDVTGQRPITFVRNNYCEHAVESEKQKKYIYNILDIPYVAPKKEPEKEPVKHTYANWDKRVTIDKSKTRRHKKRVGFKND